MRTIGLQCPTCGAWFMLRETERRHREQVHAAEMMLTGPARRANYEAGRRLYRERHPHIKIANDTRAS